jgi:hypothetical protein
MIKIKHIIHYCNYASQPYIDLYCTGYSHYVMDTTDIPEVYIADGLEKSDPDVLYTFDWENVNCEDCLLKKVS